MKLHVKTKQRTQAALNALYGVARGQCSCLMQNKCHGNKEFNEIQDKRSVVDLLKLVIRIVTHEFDSRMYLWDAMSQEKCYSYKKGEYETNIVHIKNMKNLLNAVEH